MKEIANDKLRISALEQNGVCFVHIAFRKTGGSWRTILGSGMIGQKSVWSLREELICPDPEIEWKAGQDDAELQSVEGMFLNYAEVSEDAQGLLMSGNNDVHTLEIAFQLRGEDHIHVAVRDRIADSEGSLRLGKVMTHLFFIPDGRANRSIDPLEFAWLPNLHRSEDGVCGDHFFRSPAAMVYADGLYAALAPDLDVFSRNCQIQHALDLRTIETGAIEAPRLSYGLCPYTIDGHVYNRHERGDTQPVQQEELEYAFDLFLGEAPAPSHVSRKITSFLWEKYGRRFFGNVLPQVLPFEEYGRRYTYVHELPRTVKRAVINGRNCAGLNNGHRRGANFHAWENDLNVGFGIRHYGEKWNNEELCDISDGIMKLSLQTPRKEGAFPCIYNFTKDSFEGTVFWTARCADYLHGYDAAAMGVSAWWSLYWCEAFDMGSEVLDSVVEYAHFLKRKQLPSGAIPTYFFSDLTPAKQLKESATTAIGGAVLAKVAALTGDDEFREAALAAGRYVENEIIPELLFNDFEVYYSCSPKPFYAIDYWSGIRPHSNLSLQWACDQMLSLYRLTGERKWMEQGEYLLSILSLYQQVWDPAHRSGYLFGGFGVMNTDGEWNDARQARFVPTYADYYIETGNAEYLERAISACRASFALMDMPENHENGINRAVVGQNIAAGNAANGQAEPGVGYAGENIHHSGKESHRCLWTGMNWSSGGGLAASAYLERHFGGVWVDGQSRTVTPVDGVSASIDRWDGANIHLTIASALDDLKLPYRESREVVVKFGKMPDAEYTISINGGKPRKLARKELESGGVSLTIL